MGYEYPAGYHPKEKLVIYRLKFRSQQDFAKAVQAMTVGKSYAEYWESMKRSAKFPSAAKAPEINVCHDDRCIYVVSKEAVFQNESNIFFPVSVGYFKPYLQAAFAGAEIQVTTEI